MFVVLLSRIGTEYAVGSTRKVSWGGGIGRLSSEVWWRWSWVVVGGEALLTFEADHVVDACQRT